MFRRRRRDGSDDPTDPGEAGALDEGTPDDAAGGAGAAADDGSGKSARPDGPWDADEVDLTDAQRTGRVDLGAVLVKGRPDLQLQVQVDQATQAVTGVLLVVGDAAVQLLAVAAPRNEGLWSDTRAQVAADARNRGGSAEEAEGPFGTELRLLVPVKLPDGSEGVQPSRMVGIDGPRWLLRANFLGRAAIDETAFATMAAVVRDVVVVRGASPMPPGDLIPFRLPQRDQQPAADPAPQPPGLDRLDPGPTITETR